MSNEEAFMRWYRDIAEKTGLNPNPDDPRHHYDYRAAYKAGVRPDSTGHWPSRFKYDDHPNRFIDGVDTKEASLRDGIVNEEVKPEEMTRDERQLDMWKRWQKSGDEHTRTQLLEDLQPLIKSNLGQYSSSTLPYEVLRLRANAMLRDALAGYDPKKAGLGTYTTHSLKPMARYVQKYQNVKYLPQYLVQEYGRYENAQRGLRDKLGREPDDMEMAKAMNLPERQIRRIKLAKSPEIAVSASEALRLDETADDSETTRNKDRLYYLRTTLKGTDLKIFDLLTGMGRYKPVSDRAEIARRVGIPVSEVYAKTRRWARQVK